MATRQDSEILAEALEAGMIRALDFVELASQLESADQSADELLLSAGLIDLAQRDHLLRAVQSSAGWEDTERTMSSRPGQLNQLNQASGASRPLSSHDLHQRPLPKSTPSVDTRALAFENETRYRWNEVLASGGLGAVWIAEDQRLQRFVAVKEILANHESSEEHVERFLNEARITGQLQHPGIVPVYDLGIKQNGHPFYAMKLLGETTLKDTIREYHAGEGNSSERRLQRDRLLRMFTSICNTIGYAHAKGVIHRDLKPQNVVVGEFGETVVVDWGLAKHVESNEATLDIRSGPLKNDTSGSRNQGASSSNSHKTQMGQVMGTPAYMAPEQARGELDQLNARSDIYSLGVMLYEILVGKPPHKGKTSQEVIDAVAHAKPTHPREKNSRLPKALDAICAKALAPSQCDRYGSAVEMAGDIDRWIAGERVSVYQESRFERLIRWTARHRVAATWTIVGCFLVLGCGTVSSFVVTQSWSRERDLRMVTEAARDKADQARADEVHAKNEALRHLKTALDSVDEWLLGLSADLEFYPGLSQVRQTLFREAVEAYEELANSKLHDAQGDFHKSQAWIRLGDVRRMTHDLHGAIEAYQTAITRFRARQDTSPQERDNLKQLLNAKIGLGLTLAALPDRHSDAVDVFTRAHETITSAAMLTDPDAFIPFAEARLQVGWGRLARQQTNRPQAIKHLTHARRILRELTVAHDATQRRQLALRHANLFDLASLYLESHDPRGAVDALRELNESLELSIEKQPDRPDHREGLMIAHIMLGNALQVAGADTDAANSYRLAMEDFENLIHALYRGEYQSELLANAKVNLAQIELRLGQHEIAIEALVEAKNEFATLIKRYGRQPHLLVKFATATRNLGAAYLSAEQLDAAEQQALDAIEILDFLKELAAADPTSDVELDRVDAAMAHQQLALIALMNEETERANAEIELVLKQLSGPRTAAENQVAAEALILRADLESINDQTQEAHDTYEAAMRELRVDDQESTAIAAQRTMVWLLATCPDPKTRAPEKALALSHKMIAKMPTNPDVWVVHAMAALANNDLEETKQALSRELQLRNGHHSVYAQVIESQLLRQQNEPEAADRLLEESEAAYPLHHRLPGIRRLKR